MVRIHLDFRCGTRFKRGVEYDVSEEVAAELCDRPAPVELTGGAPYAHRVVESEPEESEAEEGPDLSDLTVPELRELLEAAGLSTSGRKAELIERLETEG